MHSRPRVALFIESSRAYGRALLRGVARYAHAHGPWSIFLEPRAPGDPIPRWLSSWKGDGIIARIEDYKQADALQRTRLPVVDLRGLLLDLHLPLIETDDVAVPRLAAEHLLERGFRNFGFCGFVGHNYSDKRSAVFERLIKQAGSRCHIYEPPKQRRVIAWRQEQHGFVCEDHLAAWIQSLPKPIGLMACNDVRGQQVLNACRSSGVAVPDDVAVIGVDDDEVLCLLSDPPLSSVVPNAERIGFEAAALLDRMMAGQRPPKKPIYVRPHGIVTRQSTDVMATDDRAVAAAVRFIREQACNGIDVQHVLEEVSLSRRVLERRFSRVLGRSPKAEIIRIQLRRAKEMLAGTELPIATIAQRIGLQHAEYMSAMFRKKVGMTPTQYRTMAQKPAEPVTSR